MIGLRRVTTREPFVVAARVTGKVTNEEDLALSGKKEGEAATTDEQKDKSEKEKEDDSLVGKEPTKTDINVVLVSDIDWIAPVIFMLRERGNSEDMPIDWRFQNVAFVLNILDSLAGDDRFLEVRKRTRPHRILTKVDEATEESRREFLKQQQEYKQETKQELDTIEMVRRTEQRKLDVQRQSLESDRDRKIKQSERDLAQKVRGVQDRYKLLAVILPPIPPLLLALVVFFHRRKAEQEGVDARRLRYGRAMHGEKVDAA
jgi:ABC-2 type transport system permease protein